jgi:hypothetical protein
MWPFSVTTLRHSRSYLLRLEPIGPPCSCRPAHDPASVKRFPEKTMLKQEAGAAVLIRIGAEWL